MSSINITEKDLALTPLLRLGFRPFFLLGSLFALLGMLVWLLALQGLAAPSPLNGMLWWHSHEMLFGFVAAIISGFLLTAVQTWTGQPSIKGMKLLFLVLVWLLARVLIFVNFDISVFIVMTIDVLFLPLTAFFLAQPLIKIKQYRNMVFIPVLSLMTIANILTYLPMLDASPAFSSELSNKGFYAMVFLSTLLVALLGGRVVPMFTANGTGTTKVLPLKWLEISAMLSLVAVVIGIVFFFQSDSLLLGVLCLLSACLHLVRNLRWRPWVSFKVPLVWVLHAAMLFIPIGLFMISSHFLFQWMSFSAALHGLTVGVIGGMIIAMMSRVSLGHTGRKLNPHALMTLAFIAIIVAAFIRSPLMGVAQTSAPHMTSQLWLISGILWCLSFACFAWVYFPILSKPRADGRPG
ncbi:NnrS family protein [Ningiella sp. W23]|uniref:NnrS family protein n=1 Tax=Ningiella sp. W23 TaxID=3023715 RepID=UPI0037581121